MEIDGRTVVITGSTGKLGSAIVKAVAGRAAKCICIYNRGQLRADRLKSALEDIGGESVFIRADISTPVGIDKVFTEIEGFDSPDILINSAAVFDKRPLADITADYIRATFDINFSAAVLMAKEFVRLRSKGKKAMAKIINIADASVEGPAAGFSVYTASKAALICATKAMAKELGPAFTVNAVCPGIIDWPEGIDPNLKEKILSKIPAARSGSYDEVISAVMFVIENDYVNGQLINVDGGRGI